MQELEFLCKAISAPTRPFAAIVGGSKVSSKISVLESLMTQCDKLLIGYVFASLNTKLPLRIQTLSMVPVSKAHRFLRRAQTGTEHCCM